MPKKVAILTLGCKVNQYESACIASGFQTQNYELMDFVAGADVYVINTCTVTNRTDYKSRNAIRKALDFKEQNPHAKVVVTGCFSQRQVQQVRDLGSVDLVVDNQHKDMIPDLLDQMDDSFSDIMQYHEFAELRATSMLERSRAFLKVQDGCDFYCAYCAVPYARGHSRSRLPQKVLEQVQILTANGYREFVLGGINLGLYGLDLQPSTNLAQLMYQLEEIDDVKRLRISSIEPQLIRSEMWDYILNNQKLCHHLHISLQSGSDAILESMGRKYRTTEFRNIILRLKELYPDMAIGLDVITGFPGETDALFQETYDFLNALPFTYLHVFTYSARPGTAAAKMKHKVHGTTAGERSHQLQVLSSQKLEAYKQWICEQQIPLAGVIETCEDGYWTSLSDHFLRIYFQGDAVEKNGWHEFVPVEPFRDGVEVRIHD